MPCLGARAINVPQRQSVGHHAAEANGMRSMAAPGHSQVGSVDRCFRSESSASVTGLLVDAPRSLCDPDNTPQSSLMSPATDRTKLPYASLLQGARLSSNGAN